MSDELVIVPATDSTPANFNTPSQVANPARTTVRSLAQLALAVFTAVPLIVPIILGEWSPEWLVVVLGQVLAVQSVIVRIAATPSVNAWIIEHVPALAPIKP